MRLCHDLLNHKANSHSQPPTYCWRKLSGIVDHQESKINWVQNLPCLFQPRGRSGEIVDKFAELRWEQAINDQEAFQTSVYFTDFHQEKTPMSIICKVSKRFNEVLGARRRSSSLKSHPLSSPTLVTSYTIPNGRHVMRVFDRDRSPCLDLAAVVKR